MKMLPPGTIKRTGGRRGDVFAAFVGSDAESTGSLDLDDNHTGCRVHAVAELPAPEVDFLDWKKLDESALPPVRATEGSAGYDLHCLMDHLLPPG